MANSDRLQMIQAIITRLAGNSAAAKGFTVPTVSALLGVAIDQKRADFALLGYFVVVAFCFIDSYYLALERSYRELYRAASGESDTEWGLAADRVRPADVLACLGSGSVLLFYGAALVTVTIVAIRV